MDSVKIARLEEVLPDFRDQPPLPSVDERLRELDRRMTRIEKDFHPIKYGRDSE